jgi:large subunit ribosomal protein L6
VSRLGKIPVDVPAGVQVTIDGRTIEVKGARGTLTRVLHPEIKAELRDGKVHIIPSADNDKVRSLWGLDRMLVANMVKGISEGYRRELEIVGVGYKAELKGRDLQIAAGFSKPVTVRPEKGISFTVTDQTKIAVDGCDKELVGRVAAELRHVRPPEPYKGKGLKYAGEYIRRKAGKIAGK